MVALLSFSENVPPSVTPAPKESCDVIVSAPATPAFVTSSDPVRSTSAIPANCIVAVTSTEITREPSGRVCCSKAKLPPSDWPAIVITTSVALTFRCCVATRVSRSSLKVPWMSAPGTAKATCAASVPWTPVASTVKVPVPSDTVTNAVLPSPSVEADVGRR